MFTENFKKFLPYLEDLRRKLYVSTFVFLGMFVVGFFSAAFIIKKIITLFSIQDVVIATTSPFQFADVAMDIGFFCAVLVTLPIVMFQIFSFVSPALTVREKRGIILLVPLSVGLFLVGFLYGFFMLYYSFTLLAKINHSLGVQNIWNISSFLSQISITASLLGIVFQFPLLLTAFVRAGLLDHIWLRKKRRIAYFGVFILVSLLPPTDGISLIAMALPLLLLYEVTILINFNQHNHVWIRN